jgi:hypothetical protein
MFYDRNKFDPHQSAAWELVENKSEQKEDKDLIQCQDCDYGFPCEHQGLLLCHFHSGFNDNKNMPEHIFVKFNSTCDNVVKS